MSTVLAERTVARERPAGRLAIAALLAGLAALYVPTYLDLANGLWREDDYAHGPIILAVFAWLAWRARDAFAPEVARPAPVAGFLVLAAGLALYLVGRTQGIALFEVSSHIPVIAGAVLVAFGPEALRRLAFPLFFLVFLVPLPGFLLDFITLPLKSLVSQAVEALLVLLAYPVEREGVVLRVAGHEMLVADACSGLNSLFSLFALGLLYARLTENRGGAPWLRTALLLVAVVPIAIVANILRVLALVLVTVHFGPETAQGWVHDAAGMGVFVVALLLLVGFDSLLRRLLPAPGGRPAEVEFAGSPEPRFVARDPAHFRRVSMLAFVAGLAMAGSAAAAPVLKPVADPGGAPDLETVIPQAFGGWRVDPEVVQVAPAPDVQANLDRLYRQIVSRTYVDGQGNHMMLTVAYGGDQSDALKAHRQEVCYAAQGFEISGAHHASLGGTARDIPGTRFVAMQGDRVEPVSYWFTMGDRVVLSRTERLLVQLRHGFEGRIPDGMLVRVSSLSNDAAGAFAAQQAFIAALAAALPPQHAARFVGAPRG